MECLILPYRREEDARITRYGAERRSSCLSLSPVGGNLGRRAEANDTRREFPRGFSCGGWVKVAEICGYSRSLQHGPIAQLVRAADS